MPKKYTREHEWVLIDGDVATIGITNFAQEQLGDLVYVELPEISKKLNQGEECAVVESVKAASEVNIPLTGEIIEVNLDLESKPALINEDPENEGWIFKMALADKAELELLMDKTTYETFISNE